MNIKDHVILITGAAGGLGSTAAIALAKQGATIILLDKNLAKLEAVYDQIIAVSEQVPLIHPFDLAGANAQQYQDLADAISQQYGSLQGLLHSASELMVLGSISSMPSKSWEQCLHINLNTPFILTQVLLPVLQQSQQASIVFTSDSKVRTGKAFSSAYGVAKIGLEGLASILADELQSAGKVRVNTLVPGPINSPIRNKQFPSEDKKQLPAMTSLNEIYHYLFSDHSIGVTGQIVEAQTFNPQVKH